MNKEILYKVIHWMKIAGGLTQLTGSAKKLYVLKCLKSEILLNNILEDIIVNIIDSLILVENEKIIFNPLIKENVETLCPCFPF